MGRPNSGDHARDFLTSLGFWRSVSRVRRTRDFVRCYIRPGSHWDTEPATTNKPRDPQAHVDALIAGVGRGFAVAAP